MKVAVVTIAHGRHAHLEAQQASLARGTRRPDRYVVVAMDDPVLVSWTPSAGPRPVVVDVPAEPLGLPLARARNVGVEAALADGADAVVLLDVDCLAGERLVEGYASALRRDREVVWSGPVTYLSPPPAGGYDLTRLDAADRPHPARPAPPPGQLVVGADPDLFWSLSFAVHRGTWRRTGGFCESYVGYGAEDTDFARVVMARGGRLGWTGSARAYHQHHPTSDPPVQHLDAILRNGRTFQRRWGVWPMLGWVDAFERLGLVRRTPDGWAARVGARTSGCAGP